MAPIIGLCISVVVNIGLVYLLVQKKNDKRGDSVAEEEIRMLVDTSGNNGTIAENEKEMISNILELSTITVEEIATHRTDIVGISSEATLDEVIALVTEEKYSRIVVFNENIDNIVGIFHVKDFVKYFLTLKESASTKVFDIQSFLMKPYFVPFSKKIDELFREMQRDKIHMAIVIDEYGGTAGIVTMEDVIEEIVGNIFDEYDLEEEEDICILGENTYRINGTTDLSDVEDLLKITFEDDEDYDTLGGYLIGQMGRIPDDSEKPAVTFHGWLFQVESIDEKRIEKVYVRENDEVEADARI